MDPYGWGLHMFGWMWIFPLAVVIICLFFLFAYVFRGPRWFYGRRDRHDLAEAIREILDRRYASGEITKEQYAEMKRTLMAN